MLVANSFDLWQKDAFFSAAEEVQESADIMESAYRRWVRERRERPSMENLDELGRELQTALGTAKWQLDEFGRAVRVSYGHRGEDSSTARHSQFISVIESQISRVESDLRDSFLKDGKKPLRWVNLDEEECDDLAAFLTGTSQIAPSVKDEIIDVRTPTTSTVKESQIKIKDASIQSSGSSKRGTSDEMTSGNEETVTSNTRRIWSTRNFADLKIVIADEDEQRNNLVSESTPKERGSKFVFWKRRFGEFSRANGPVNFFNQIFSRASGSQRQFIGPPRMQYGRSIRVTLALMLTLFLIVPFLLLSS